MKKIQEINDVCKEVLTILAYVDTDLIEKIPDNILQNLQELAANSKVDFFINEEKNLNNQDISEECKDLIALLYYSYIADEKEKKELLKIWNNNEEKYRNELHEKYNPDDLFKRVVEQERADISISENKNALIKYKESIFSKFKNFIFKILHINN